MKPNEISGYRVESISIIESKFSRSDSFTTANQGSVNVNLAIDNAVLSKTAKCKLRADVIVRKTGSDKVIAEGTATAYGIFKQRVEEPKISISNFAALNAQAIMYPFLREHMASLSLKAGMNAIMLPSVNFVAFMNNKKQAESLDD